MAALVGALQSVRMSLGGDDDGVDKISCRYSVVLLLVFCAVVSTKQYVGDPINCWVPGTYTGAMTEYTNNMCWIKNTYYIELGQHIPNTDEEVEGKELNYYQWVPIFLCIQALMFYFPSLLWKTMNHRSGCHVRHVVKMFTDATIMDPESRKKTIQFTTLHIDKFLITHKRQSRGETAWYHRILRMCCIGRTYGNFILLTYMFIKLVYLVNSLTQILVLNGFVGRNYNLYGLEVLRDLSTGHMSKESHRFPRSTLCSFKVREFGNNIHRHTVQCVLAINLFNEKIYAFLWFWLVFVIVATLVSILPWVWGSMRSQRIEFCRACLKQTEMFAGDNMPSHAAMAPFIDNYLRQDGVFVLKMIGANVNEVVLCEVVESLYLLYKNKKKDHGGEVEMERLKDDGHFI